MLSKKDIPLNLLKAIEKIALENFDLIQLDKEDNTYYNFVENDANSKNYFKIFIDGSKVISNYDHNGYAFKWRPSNEYTTRATVHQGKIEDVVNHINAWLKIIREYHETPSIHDDAFTKSYSDFYYNEFRVYDEDANTAPFNPIQQEKIELYLDSLIYGIKNSQEQIDEQFRLELISEIKDIKENITTTTKNNLTKRITKIFGKLFKHSKKFGNEVVKEAKKELVKKLIELGVEYAPKLIELVSGT